MIVPADVLHKDGSVEIDAHLECHVLTEDTEGGDLEEGEKEVA